MPASTHIWSGAVDTSWTVAGNWVGGVPNDDGDKVIFPKGNTKSCLVGLDQSAITSPQNGLNLALLKTEEGYSGSVGSSGNYLKICSDRVVVRGSGEFWYEDKTHTSSDHTTDEIVIDTTNGEVTLNGANIERVLITRGKVTFAGSISPVGQVEIINKANPLPRVTFTAGASAVYDTVIMNAGTVTSDCIIRRLNMSAGEWSQNTQKIQHLEMFGGLVNYLATTLNGTMMQAKVMGGTLDFTQSTDEKKCLDLFAFPHAVIRKDDDIVTIVNERYMGETRTVKL